MIARKLAAVIVLVAGAMLVGCRQQQQRQPPPLSCREVRAEMAELETAERERVERVSRVILGGGKLAAEDALDQSAEADRRWARIKSLKAQLVTCKEAGQ